MLLAGFLGPLLVGMMSNLNLGLHHILPIYPFVAMLGALAAARFWRLSGRPVLAVSARAVVLLLLIGWNLETCLHAAPDFFAYFNEPAAPHDSYILIGSDLDWGQDLKRLSSELQRLHVQHVSLAVWRSRSEPGHTCRDSIFSSLGRNRAGGLPLESIR